MDNERVCRCEDCAGRECGKPMSLKEKAQDGMCSSCADSVWGEMSNDEVWYHVDE